MGLSDRVKAGQKFDLATLEVVAAVQDSGVYGGLCPNWMIPSHIPSQRLSGLARRGFLTYAKSRWALTRKGIDYLDVLRRLEAL